jgi:DNA-binding beta-propeller fold protein YncE
MGITIAYDRAHAAVFYTGEFTHRVARYDRRTGQLTDAHSEPLARRWIQPVTLRQYTGSSVLYTNSIHRGHDRIYLAEWMEGRHAWAIDLTTLDVVARYDVGGGGSLGVTVDEPRDRLFVSSVWGFEVFDLATDRLIARRRTGLGNRPVIVDAARNRLYLPSMVEGKIRILDRDTFEVIGQIPVGMGGRFAHLSADGKYLFASSASAHYYFDADALVPGH